MGNYDFSGLSTRSFEKLTQALAVRILGAGTIIFGDGPDGGREAIYQGRVKYPSAAEQWDGYIVLQAKFRQRLTDRKTDADWAEAQLRAELDAFADPKKARPTPEFFIFITNVVLTPVRKTGGKDRIAKVFKDYQKKVPLKGWRVWDYDQLATFLDTEEAVRNAYAAFITAGDVLAAVMKFLQPDRQDFSEVMSSYLAQELGASKYANLEQTSASRVLLSRVFVDLPFADQRVSDPPDEAKESLAGVVSMLLATARERFDPESTRSSGEGPNGSRYVFVGGPGQGKTTVGQFACQLFRAAILRDRRDLQSPEVQEALTETEKISELERIEIPSARRFPIHVVLRDFATALSRRRTAIDAGQPVSEFTLFAYLVERIRTRTNREVTNDDFRAWLRAYPWILVLDGLDEVPSSSNRSEVLQKIEDFWTEASQAKADLLVVATTRPQDYQDDFSPRYYVHKWLVPLSTARALKYGKRLLEMRHGEGSDRYRELAGRLEEAAESEATARLMRTPLQITIMSTLVEQVGKPPQDRWRLFDEYYHAIYRRERERTTSDLLGRHQSDIDAIHHRTGLELQILSESSGGTDARLSAKHFTAIVRQRLEDEGHEGEALERLVKEIVDAATLRLVFIVGLDVDSVGFEIRSLQEFMAAEALLSADTATMQRRLRAIAGATSWRNVYVFAAGRCFARIESLIDTIHAICQELNSERGDMSRGLMAGSMLALELLEDAAVEPKPKHARLLARTALMLLDAPSGDVHIRLAGVCTETVEAVFEEEIVERLKTGDWVRSLGAWKTANALGKQGMSWAKTAVETAWPSDPVGATACVLSVPPSNDRSLVARAQQCYTRTPVQSQDSNRLREWLNFATGKDMYRLVDREYADLNLQESDRGGFSLVFMPIDSEQTPFSLNATHPDVDPSFKPFIVAASHGGGRDASSLAEILEELSETPYETQWPWPCSWPLAAALRGAGHDDLSATARRLRKGELGDRDEWLMAEKRWSETGVTLEDLHARQDPWPSNIATVGFPYATDFWSTTGNQSVVAGLSHMFDVEKDSALKAAIARWLLFSAETSQLAGRETQLSLELLLSLVNSATIYFSTELVGLLHRDSSETARTIVDVLGRRYPSRWYVRTLGTLDIEYLISLLAADTTNTGIARVITLAITPETAVLVRDTLPDVVHDPNDPPMIQSAVAVFEALSADRRKLDVAILVNDIACDFPDAAELFAELLAPPYRPADETVLTGLLRELDPRHWRARNAVRHSLENIFKSQPGPPRHASFWRDLGFPGLHLA